MYPTFYLVTVSDYSGFLGVEYFITKEEALKFIQEDSDGCTFYELYKAHHIDR